jgi:hypothetical protein
MGVRSVRDRGGSRDIRVIASRPGLSLVEGNQGDVMGRGKG